MLTFTSLGSKNSLEHSTSTPRRKQNGKIKQDEIKGGVIYREMLRGRKCYAACGPAVVFRVCVLFSVGACKELR